MHALTLSKAVSIPFTAPFSLSAYASSLVSRIYSLTVQHFSLLQNICVAGFGGKELLVDFLSQDAKLHKKKDKPSLSLIEGVADKHLDHLKKIKKINAEFSLIHGMFYLGSGIWGGAEAMHGLQWINLGQALPFVSNVAAGLFLYANLFSLEQNIKLFYHAEKLGEDPDQSVLANRIKISAVLGIINNIGYIFSTIAYFFPSAEIPYILLTCFAIFFGCIKIVYDFFFVTPNLNAID